MASSSNSEINKIEELSLGDDTVLTAEDLVSDDEPVGKEYDGDLPDFSDNEEPATPVPSTSTRLPPPKPKGPLGRKKAPAASSLKKKLASSVPGTKENKAKKAVAAEEQQVAAVPGGVKLTDEQLDAVMAQLEETQPELKGKLTREDVQQFIHTTGINKKVLQGKQGLMGKNAKDMA